MFEARLTDGKFKIAWDYPKKCWNIPKNFEDFNKSMEKFLEHFVKIIKKFVDILKKVKEICWQKKFGNFAYKVKEANMPQFRVLHVAALNWTDDTYTCVQSSGPNLTFKNTSLSANFYAFVDDVCLFLRIGKILSHFIID